MGGGGLELDLTLVLMYGGPDAFERSAVPTILSLWVDPRWGGAWAQACGAGEREGLVYAVFRLRERLAPVRSSSMQRAAGTAGTARSVGDSLKIHLFMPSCGAPEFRFGSACALDALQGGGAATLGVWNGCDDVCIRSGTAMRGWLLSVASHGALAIPRGVQLQRRRAPTRASYQRVDALCNWMAGVLEGLYGACASPFLYPTATGRDGWQMGMLHDLPRLYATPEGSPLPPLLALYVMANALVLSGVPPAAFLDAAARAAGEQACADVVVAVVRQAVCAFAVCGREGEYWPDESVGRPAEDEPFPFTFRPPRALRGSPETFFEEDDCEGRMSQVKGLADLLRCLSADARRHGGRWARRHLRAHAACVEALLPVGPEALEALLGCCVAAGGLFQDGQLQAVMGMGDGELGRFDGTGRPGLCAHSFGALLYDGGRGVRGCMVLEATGWTGPDAWPRPGGAEGLKQELKAFIKSESGGGCRRRVGMTPQDEDAYYRRLLLGDGKMFWTCPGGGGCPELGASFRGLRGGVLPYSAAAWRAAAPGQVLAVGLEEWMRALAGGGGPWPAVEGAQRAADDYAAHVAQYGDFAGVLRPPPDDEGTLVRRMAALFGPIRAEDLPAGVLGEACCVGFSYLADAEGAPELLRRWRAREGLRVQAHRFMQSVVVLARCAGG